MTSSSHVRMWELDYKESWAPKNWCFWTVVLEKTLESPLFCKEIKPVHPKGNQSWIFNGRTDAEAETPILWPPDSKNWFIGKDPDGGKDWRREEKEMTEVKMFGWHHWLDGHEFEQAPGVGEGQRSLACCSPWGGRVGYDWATELNWIMHHLSLIFRQNQAENLGKRKVPRESLSSIVLFDPLKISIMATLKQNHFLSLLFARMVYFSFSFLSYHCINNGFLVS